MLTKKAFTLVELIVTITILAILWAIAFISLQWYNKSARDSKRISDISDIRKSLELYTLNWHRYPETSSWTKITYSWSEAWIQWTFWESTFINVDKLDNVPLDPLTETEYVYSVTNSRYEYEIWWILEWGLLSLDNHEIVKSANAIWEKSATAYITWNYNGRVLKVNAGNKLYILAVPSIINWDISLTSIEEIVAQNKLVFDWFNNLPSSYRDSVFNADWEWILKLVNSWSLVVFSWSLSDLLLEATQLTFIDNLQQAYNSTDIVNVDEIKTILSYSNSNTEWSKYLAQVIIKNNIDKSVPITAINTPNSYGPWDFVSTWNVWIDTWVSWYNNLKLPLQSNGTYNFTVDWWDGTTDTITTYNQAETTHNYWTWWIYEVIISWTIDWFAFNAWNIWSDNQEDWDKLIDISQWWNLKLSDWWRQFSHCENLTGFSATDTLDISNITSMEWMFLRAYSFNGDISQWDVSGVTDMSNMFYLAMIFNGDISQWDVSNVTNMSSMFINARKFNQNIGWWNVSSVTNMSSMFNNALVFNQDIGWWNVSSVTNMSSMFYYANVFNQNIGWWNVSSVTNMSAMFYVNRFGNSYVFNADISQWNVSNVTDMSAMFYNAKIFNANISQWNVSSVTNMSNMFNTANAFNADISQWNVLNVTNMSSMFSEAYAFNADISQWNVSSVTNMSNMFNNALVFNQDIGWWNVSNVTNMNSMFKSALNFNGDIIWWNVSNVTNMNMMFDSARAFNIDISQWNVSKVTNMSYMFRSDWAFNQNLTPWNIKTNLVTSCTELDTQAIAWDVLNKPTFPNCVY